MKKLYLIFLILVFQISSAMEQDPSIARASSIISLAPEKITTLRLIHTILSIIGEIAENINETSSRKLMLTHKPSFVPLSSVLSLKKDLLMNVNHSVQTHTPYLRALQQGLLIDLSEYPPSNPQSGSAVVLVIPWGAIVIQSDLSHCTKSFTHKEAVAKEIEICALFRRKLHAACSLKNFHSSEICINYNQNENGTYSPNEINLYEVTTFENEPFPPLKVYSPTVGDKKRTEKEWRTFPALFPESKALLWDHLPPLSHTSESPPQPTPEFLKMLPTPPPPLPEEKLS